MYNYGKVSKKRLSEFARSTKSLLLYGSTSSIPKSNSNNSMKKEEKRLAKQPELKAEVSSVTIPIIQETASHSDVLTQVDLQQAIIWSEILGKPVCKRRVRRYYGD